MAIEPTTPPEEVTEPTSEKTFTQEEVNAIVARRVSAAKRGLPDEAELTAFRTWKENQQSEQENKQIVTEGRDKARNELKAAQQELEAVKRTVYLLQKGITGDEAEFIEFKAMKMVDDKTTFEAAVDELTKGRTAAQRVDFAAPLSGDGKTDTTGNVMNKIIRGAYK